MRCSIIAGPRVETAAYRALDLQSALILCAPSLILEERPADGTPFPPDSPEGRAISAYGASRREGLQRLCVDMAGRDEAFRRIGYLEAEKGFFEEARDLAEHGKLSGNDMSMLAAWEFSRKAYGELFSASLRQANARSLGERLAAAEDMKYALALRLCGSCPRLADRLPSFTAAMDLLAKRRKEMAGRIMEAIGRLKPRSAVLVCGAAEKQRMARALAAPLASLGGRLLEFWEVE